MRKRKTAAWSDDGSAADSSGEQGDDGDDEPAPGAPSGASVAIAGANLPSLPVSHPLTPWSLFLSASLGAAWPLDVHMVCETAEDCI